MTKSYIYTGDHGKCTINLSNTDYYCSCRHGPRWSGKKKLISCYTDKVNIEKHITDIFIVVIVLESQRIRICIKEGVAWFIMCLNAIQSNEETKIHEKTIKSIPPPEKGKKRQIIVQCKNRMDRYHILFCKTTSLIHQDGGNISSPVCFGVLSGLVMDEGPGDTHLQSSSNTTS